MKPRSNPAHRRFEVFSAAVPSSIRIAEGGPFAADRLGDLLAAHHEEVPMAVSWATHPGVRPGGWYRGSRFVIVCTK